MITNKPQFNPSIGSKFVLAEITEDNTTVEAVGFSGPSCHAATKPFEDALGGTVTDRHEKPPEAGQVKLSH